MCSSDLDEEDRDPERGDDLPDDAHQDAAQEGAAPQGPLLLVRQASRRHLAPSSDAGKIMPPKSTWFEPKLISGLFLHLFHDR